MSRGLGPRAARPLNPATWLLAPALALALASFLLAVPLRLWGLRLPEPVLGVGLAFAWALARPSVLAPFAVLAVGLWLDLLWGAALGMWGLSLLLAYAGVAATRPLISGQARMVVWAWYAGAVAIALGAAYLFTMLDVLVRPSLAAAASQAAFTVLLYPVVERLAERLDETEARFR